jgi:hypothetical protein
LPTGDDGHFTLPETPAADAMLATFDKASEQSMQLLTDVGILRDRLRDLYASAAELNAHGQHNQAAVVQRNIVATHQRLNQLETPPKTDAQITPYVEPENLTDAYYRVFGDAMRARHDQLKAARGG